MQFGEMPPSRFTTMHPDARVTMMRSPSLKRTWRLPTTLSRVAGGKLKTVTGAREGQQIVLYAKNGTWWLQPLLEAPFTKISPSHKWYTATHLGSDYAALLVDRDYRPDHNIKTLPAVGGPVAAVSVTKGASASPTPTLKFSGYEWRVRTSVSNRGGRDNPYSAANAFVDEGGALHLCIKKKGDRFACAEVALARSFGYGTYTSVYPASCQRPRLPTNLVMLQFCREAIVSPDTCRF